MFKKTVSVLLVFCLCVAMMPAVLAEESPDVSPEALRVSDEFAAQYPNGLIEFATTNFETSEDAEDFTVYVVRRGGISGTVSVDIKVIETSAKYYDDFTVLIPAYYGDKELEKDSESPTILESAVESGEYSEITGDDDQSGGNAQTVDNAQTTGSAQTFVNAQTTGSAVQNYTSSLHQLRDEALGMTSKAPKASGSSTQVFSVQDSGQVRSSSALNSVMPGATATLTFNDGENYKTFQIHICDDDKVESPEQFTLGLCNETGGTVLGDAVSAGCNISDNDEGGGSVIGFAQDIYSVHPSDRQAELTLVRTGDTDTYSTLEISTLSGTAKADRDYDPVMSDAIFLPGETGKTVKIPLLIGSNHETLSFEVVVTKDGKEAGGISRATVNILPEEKDAALKAASSVSLLSASSTNDIVINGEEFLLKYVSQQSMFHSTYTPSDACRVIPPHGRDICISDYGGGTSSMYKYLDLRGIGSITIDWQQSGQIGCNSNIYMNGTKYYTLEGRFNGTTMLNYANDFPREKTVEMDVTSEASFYHGSLLGVRSLTLHRQEFPVVIWAADQLSYTKWEGRSSMRSVSYDPDTLTSDSTVACLDDTITLTPRFSLEGSKRGAEYIGYAINTKNGWVNFYDKSSTIRLTPEFITTYIYGNEKNKWHEALNIKPLFKTSPVRVVIQTGDTSQGSLYWGDYPAGSSPELGNIDWVSSGDELVFDLAPKTGYSGKGFKVDVYGTEDDLHTGRSTGREVDLPTDSVIMANGINYITPIYTRNDKSVAIEWKRYEVGETEPMELDITRGILLHDHADYMPAAEKAVLYKGTTAVITSPDIDDYITDGVVDEISYKQAMSTYKLQSEARYGRILENYPAYRSLFSTRTLEHLPIGEMVTLYAQPQKGYTVIWEVEDSASTADSSEFVKYIAHMGPSFTFEVTNTLKKVYYYFIKVNDAGENILTGKVIQGKNTLRSEQFLPVDKKDPDSYTGVSNVSVSVAVADPGLSSITLNGRTYCTTAVTDKDGNFQIYLPFGVPNQLYSVKAVNGNNVYAESVLVGKNILIELPFMDNFKVSKFTVSGADNSNVSVENKTADISFSTTSTDDRVPAKVKLRSYNSDGALWQTIDADTANCKDWTVNSLNLKETFKDGGRLTVEIYDDHGVGHGEIESGYSFTIKPEASDVNLPSLESPNGTDVDVVGTVNPGADLGSVYSLVPDVNGKTYTIAVNAGETIKTLIAKNVGELDGKTPLDKVIELAAYLPDTYSTSKSKDIDWKKSAAAKPGLGKATIDLDFDIGFYIQITKQTSDSDTDFVLDYAIIYAAAKVAAQQDFTTSIYGIPVYLRLRGSANIRTLVLAQGDAETKLDLAYGWFPKPADLSGTQFGGVVAFGMVAAIGGGVGTRGVLSAGLEGELDFNIAYEPWNNCKGTLTLMLNADIDVLVIPLHFTLAKKEFNLFQTDDFKQFDWISDIKPTGATAQALDSLSRSDLAGSVGTFSRTEAMSAWNGVVNEIVPNDGGVIKTTLQNNIFKHPEPQVLSLGEGIKILFFINDDTSRGDYDRSALYYSVYNGNSWSEPALVQDDGTLDYEPYAKLVGNRVLVAWSSTAGKFGDAEPEMSALLNNGDIYVQFFNLNGNPDGNITRLTFNGDSSAAYGDATPRIAYDEESKDIMLLYLKTDYSTEGVEYSKPSDIGDFVSNSYCAVAYRMYTGGEWQTSYYEDETGYLRYEEIHGAGSLHGERFIDFDLAGVDPAKISEISLGSYDGEAQIIYTYDIDSDQGTKEDTELFMKVFSFSQRQFTPPVRLTDDLTEDTNPQQVEYGGKDYLFWNHDGCITYLDIYSLLNFDLTRYEGDGEYYYVLKNGYESFLKVFDMQNHAAGESFTVTLGKDGGLYVSWNELSGDGENSDSRGRQLFAATYDPKNYRTGTTEDGNPIYTGGWGVPQQLSCTLGEYNSEQSICVDKNGMVTVISRTYECIPDESTAKDDSDIRESDISSLVERRFTPVSRLEADASGVTTYPEYPGAGEPVTLTVEAKNAGLLPLDGATFRFEIGDGAGSWTPLCGDVVRDYHISSDEDVSGTTSFTMPEDFSADSPVELRITAWTGDGAENASQTLYTISPADSLEYNDLKGRFIDEDTVRITGILRNTGNADAEGVTINIASHEDRAISGDAAAEEPLMLAKLTVGTVSASNSYQIDKTVDIDATAIESGSDMEFILSASRSGGDDTCTGLVMATKRVVDTEASDILINDGKAVAMSVGTMVSLRATVLPYAAANTHRLHYTSLTPDIAEVDVSSGMVTAKRAGTAQILVESETVNGGTYLLDADGILYGADGNEAEFDDTGAVTGTGGDAESGRIAAAKTVTFTVAAQDEDKNSGSNSDIDNSNAVRKTEPAVILEVAPGKTVTGTDISSALNKITEGGSLLISSPDSLVGLNGDALKILGNSGTDVAFSLGGALLRLPGAALNSIYAQADSGGVEISIKQAVGTDGKPVVDITIKSGGTEITGFGRARLLISVPYTLQSGEDPDAVLIYNIYGSDRRQLMTSSRYEDGAVLCMTNHLSKYTVGYNKVDFADGDGGGWAEEYIRFLSARGIAAGDGKGNFLPGRAVTRAEFVKMLALLSGDKLPSASGVFKDVARSAWYSPYIAWAAQKGYVNGVTAATFAPDDNITREQMAAVIVRFINAEGYNLNVSGSTLSFTDANKISNYAKEAVGTLCATGILCGRNGGDFAPQDSATRAESVKVFTILIYKLLEAMNS